MKTILCALILFVTLVVMPAAQGGGPVAPPLVKEGATVKLGAYSYAIPDGSVGQVPNVGIVVGSRATLVIDPGMGRRNGETVLREVQKLTKNAEMYVASTHYHVEHTLGYLGLPNARYINSTIQEAEFGRGMGAAGQAVRGPRTGACRGAGRRDRTQGGHHLRPGAHARSRRRARPDAGGRPHAYARRHGLFRRGRQRPLRRRRGHERIVRGRQSELEHESMAGRPSTRSRRCVRR